MSFVDENIRIITLNIGMGVKRQIDKHQLADIPASLNGIINLLINVVNKNIIIGLQEVDLKKINNVNQTKLIVSKLN